MSCNNSSWDEEDCAYLLRQLEISAFSSVVSALRAQGVLNKFKGVVLDSLKRVLFITDEHYKSELRKAANDENLTKVAKVLNPSYDTFTEWGIVSAEFDDELEVPQPRHFDGVGTHAIASSLLSLATLHNNEIDEDRTCLEQILNVPPLPYVPERLRRYLRGSEFQLDTEHPCLPGTSKSTAASERNAGRKRHSNTDIFLKEEEDCNPSTSAESLIEKPKIEKISYVKTNSRIFEKPPEVPVGNPDDPSDFIASNPSIVFVGESGITYKIRNVQKGASPFIPYEQATQHEVDSILRNIQKQMQEGSTRQPSDSVRRSKRKPKLASESSPTDMKDVGDCARARPFIFEKAANGTKAPRGNPDKRWGPVKPTAMPVTPPAPSAPVVLPTASPQAVYPQPIRDITPSKVVRPTSSLNSSARISSMQCQPGSAIPAGIVKRPRLHSISESSAQNNPDVSQLRSPLPNVMKPKQIQGYLTPDTQNKTRPHPHGSPVAFVTSSRMVATNSINPRSSQPRPLNPTPSMAHQSAPSDTGTQHGHDYGTSGSTMRTVYRTTIATNQNGGRTTVSNPLPIVTNPNLLPVVRRLVAQNPQISVGQLLLRKDNAGSIKSAITDSQSSSAPQIVRRIIATNAPVISAPFVTERPKEPVRVEHPNGMNPSIVVQHPPDVCINSDNVVIRPAAPVPAPRQEIALPFSPTDNSVQNSSVQHEFHTDTPDTESVGSHYDIS